MMLVLLPDEWRFYIVYRFLFSYPFEPTAEPALTVDPIEPAEELDFAAFDAAALDDVGGRAVGQTQEPIRAFRPLPLKNSVFTAPMNAAHVEQVVKHPAPAPVQALSQCGR